MPDEPAPYRLKRRLAWAAISIPFVVLLIVLFGEGGWAASFIYMAWVFAPGAVGIGGGQPTDEE